jgi:hypothetical protein
LICVGLLTIAAGVVVRNMTARPAVEVKFVR